MSKLPFQLSKPITSLNNKVVEGQTLRIQNYKIIQDLQIILNRVFSVYSPISFKNKNEYLHFSAMVVPFNNRLNYVMEIVIDYAQKTFNLSYVLCREHGQQYSIESKQHRLLITRGLNKLNQTSDIGVYTINNKGGIRFKQHLFIDHQQFNEFMKDYQIYSYEQYYGNNSENTMDIVSLRALLEDQSFKSKSASSNTLNTALITLFKSNIEMHIPHLNINIAKILFLCDELPREYFGILERQQMLESQKQLDQVDTIFKEIEETTTTDKLFEEEIGDSNTSAFQTPAQQVENGLKTKIVQEIIIQKIVNQETIGQGGFGDIYKAEIRFQGIGDPGSSSSSSYHERNTNVLLDNFQNSEKTTNPMNNKSYSQSNSQAQFESSNNSSFNNNNNSNSQLVLEESKEYHTKTYVLKENKQEDNSTSDRNRVQHEIDILMLLQDYECPYIAKYFFSKQKEYEKYLIIEFYRNKDLDTFRRNFSNTSSLISKIELMYQFSSGLKFLNDRGFYHLDIKPANILISNKQQIKITDFGECYHNDVCDVKYRCDWDPHYKQANQAHLDKIDWKKQAVQGPVRGQSMPQYKPAKTMPYCPPESLTSKLLQINYQSDIFSLGIMMCEIFFDEFPFKFKKSRYTQLEEKFKECKWECFMPEEYVCKHKGPEKIIQILLKLALRCLSASKLESYVDPKTSTKGYKLDRPCISQIIIVLKKCKEYLEQRYVNAFVKL